MKILFLNSLFPPHVGGGAEIMLDSIVRGMQSLGHDVTVVATGDEPGVVLTMQDGLPVYRIGIRNIYWPHASQTVSGYKRAIWHLADVYNPLMACQLADVVDQVMPDIVSVHNLPGFSIAAYSVFIERRIPIVQVLHDYYLLCPRVNLFSNGKICEHRCASCRMYRLPHNKLTDQVSAVVGVSKAVLQQHLAQGAFKDVPIKAVIYNARALNPMGEAVPHANHVVRFGFIGTLSEVKGVEPMIEAFLRVVEQTPISVSLYIGGTGKDDFVAHLTTKYSSPLVHFLGKVIPEEFFASIDISIVPSVWHDPFPGVVYESLGYGVPVIGARRGGIPELIKHGSNGLLFEPDNKEGLVEAMLLILNNKNMLARFKLESRDSVQLFLNVNRMINEHQELMLNLVLASSLNIKN